MSNILDYVSWRGDLPFSYTPFNEIDALILCQIAYINFDGLISENFSEKIMMSQLAKKFRETPDYEKRTDMGALINKLSTELFFSAAESARFGDVQMSGFVNVIDTERVEQFAAVTFTLEKNHSLVVFRGTDDTIVGWNEDFNLGVLETVPAQKDALDYLTKAISSVDGDLRVAGHSKGGNLSIYSSANIEEKDRKRIIAIYNNDGPGFSDATIASPEFQAVIPKVQSFYPQFSIVGMLFSHAGEYKVVKSDETGIMQHDPFSWHLNAKHFDTLESLDSGSIMFHNTFNSWFGQLDEAHRKQFVDTLFLIIQATDARTNSEIEKNAFESSAKIIHALLKLDNDTRTEIWKTVELLFNAANKNLPDLGDLISHHQKTKIVSKEKKDKKFASKKLKKGKAKK